MIFRRKRLEKSLKATDLEYDSFKHAFLTLPFIFVAGWECMSLSNVLSGGCFQTFLQKMIKSEHFLERSIISWESI